MTQLSFSHHEFGDSESEGYGESVWIAARIGNTKHGIGAYVYRDGRIRFNDHSAWCVENDLAAAGIDPDSREAEALLDEWRIAARELANGLFAKLDGSAYA